MQPHLVRIETNVQVTWIRQLNPNGIWVAWCDLLGISVEGDTHEELVSAISESLEVLFEDLFEAGDLDPYLLSKGWRMVNPPERASGNPKFDVPWTMVDGRHQSTVVR